MSVDLITYLLPYKEILYLGVGVAFFVLFIWNIVLTTKLSGLKKRFKMSITNYSDDFNLEDMLAKTVSEVTNFRNELDQNVKICADANNKTNDKFDRKLDELHKMLINESRTLREMIDVINKNLNICVQKTAVVRYNPFDHVGGELCFALSALDKTNCGFILNTIFTDAGCYTYCKPVVDGVSSIKLSPEEQQSLDLAKNKIS